MRRLEFKNVSADLATHKLINKKQDFNLKTNLVQSKLDENVNSRMASVVLYYRLHFIISIDVSVSLRQFDMVCHA